MKCVAFDLELANTRRLPSLKKGDNIWALWPLNISVGATYCLPEKTVDLWFSRDTAGVPRRRGLRRRDAKHLVNTLYNYQQKGLPIVSWNGTGFDFQLLARLLPNRKDVIIDMTLKSYDPMFQLLCSIGYMPGLEAAGLGIGLPPKPMEGASAPALWGHGFFAEVMDYVSQDAITTGTIAEHIFTMHSLSWITKAGDVHWEPIPRLLTVEQCLNLPLPKTGSMQNPLKREDFINWFDE